MRCAVVGGGAFGCMISLRLAQEGADVTLFERLPELMSGASYNNQNRLHLGFHYPRDAETARQCIRGFEHFRSEFSDCILDGFPNSYFIASEGSFTTPEGFLAFCDNVGLAYEEFDTKAFEPKIQNVALGVKTGELVYDSKLVRAAIERRLSNSGVVIRKGTQCDAISQTDDGGFDVTCNGKTERFDVVVNCTYADINRLTAELGYDVSTYQFEYTAVAVVDLDWDPLGITIMDGRFMTVLPFGKTGKFLLYHVEDVVIAREDAPLMDKTWLDISTSPFEKRDKSEFFNTLVAHCAFFVPGLESAKLSGFLQGPRMVLSKRDNTDERPSIIKTHGDGYVTVFSGKIDHCMWVAEDVLRILGIAKNSEESN